MVDVLFVCLGNICRSPMAEAVFGRMVEEAGLAEQIRVSSAGTGDWHVGEPAHRGTRQTLQAHGITYTGRARQVSRADITEKTYLIALDRSNRRELQRRFGKQPRLHLLLDFAPGQHGRDVPDPYYTGNFEEVFQLVSAGCRGLLAMILEEEGLQSREVTSRE